jgi:hypothetical protein
MPGLRTSGIGRGCAGKGLPAYIGSGNGKNRKEMKGWVCWNARRHGRPTLLTASDIVS